MKKQLFKHLTQLATALSLCAAVLATVPSDDETGSGATTNGSNIITENSSSEEPSNDPSDIFPQNDREPSTEIKK